MTRPGTLQEALRKSGFFTPTTTARIERKVEHVSQLAKQINEKTERMNVVIRGIEDKIRATPGACTRVVAVPFPHPDYDDPHELAWSSRRGKWRLVLRWDDGADPVLCCSRSVRAAVLGSDELRVLLVKLGVS